MLWILYLCRTLEAVAQKLQWTLREQPEYRHNKDALNMLRYIHEDEVPGQIIIL